VFKRWHCQSCGNVVERDELTPLPKRCGRCGAAGRWDEHGPTLAQLHRRGLTKADVVFLRVQGIDPEISEEDGA
jgi:hypothetical protein